MTSTEPTLSAAAWKRRCFLALLLLVGCGAPLSPARAAEPVGQVVRQQGGVLAVLGSMPRALALGSPVYSGDRILTRAAARVAIEFADGSFLAIGEDTELEIVSYPQGGSPEEGGLLRLLSGILRATLSAIGRPRGLEVETHAAVASARSTDWIVEAAEKGTAVFVVEGSVEVSARGRPAGVLLTEGLGTDVAPGSAPQPPKRWGEKRVAEVLARTTVPQRTP